MGFIVKNPPKQSVSLKNVLEEKNVKRNVKKLYFKDVKSKADYYPVHLLVIPMYICASQSLFSHSYVVNEWLNRHCDAQIDIIIRADELGI
jgi:hypothetical protein